MKVFLLNYLSTNPLYSTYEFIDKGCFGVDRCDYPDVAEKVCNAVLAAPDRALGILICGTGIGISIAANKIRHIRCAVCHDTHTAEMARKHNHANVIALGGRLLSHHEAKNIMNTFLQTHFEGGRHKERIHKIHLLEN